MSTRGTSSCFFTPASNPFRRNTLSTAARGFEQVQACPAALRFRHPDGGMFLWAQLADHVRPGTTTAALLAEAVDRGVAFVPGRAFAADDPSRHDRWLRLSFATGEPAALDEAIRRLAGVLAGRPLAA